MDGDAFERALAAGRLAWPGIELEPEAFRRHLVHVVGGSGQSWQRQAADLYLACACTLDSTGARDALDHVLGELIEQVSGAPACTSAARAVLHAKLLGPGSALARYSGGAPLAPWLSVIGTRVVMDTLRDREPRAAPPVRLD